MRKTLTTIWTCVLLELMAKNDSDYPSFIKDPEMEKTEDDDTVLIDQNKKELEKFFNINMNMKYQITLTASAFALLIFVVAAYTTPLKDQILGNFFQKPASLAVSSPTAQYQIAAEFEVVSDNAQINSNQFEVGLELVVTPKVVGSFKTNIIFDPKLISLVKVSSGSAVITRKIIDNKAGEVELLGKLENQYLDQASDNSKVATLTFKKLKEGMVKISPANSVFIEQNDYIEAQIKQNSLQIELVNTAK